jgi:hypothetical protein
LVLAAVALVATGCVGMASDPGLESRVAALRQEQAQRQIEIAALQQQEQQARRLLEQRQCQAAVAGLLSQVAIARAQCLEARSQFAACEARNTAHTSHGGMWGAVAGIAASVLTGGAAAPLVLTGMGLGLASGKATRDQCGASPVCTPDDQVLLPQVFAGSGLSALPTCQ